MPRDRTDRDRLGSCEVKVFSNTSLIAVAVGTTCESCTRSLFRSLENKIARNNQRQQDSGDRELRRSKPGAQLMVPATPPIISTLPRAPCPQRRLSSSLISCPAFSCLHPLPSRVCRRGKSCEKHARGKLWERFAYPSRNNLSHRDRRGALQHRGQMGKLHSLGADTICNIVAFSLGADIVALLTTNRCVHKVPGSLIPATETGLFQHSDFKF